MLVINLPNRNRNYVPSFLSHCNQGKLTSETQEAAMQNGFVLASSLSLLLAG